MSEPIVQPGDTEWIAGYDQGVTDTRDAAYALGYAAGKEAAEREALRKIAAILQATGPVKVPTRYFLDSAVSVMTWEDIATDSIVCSARQEQRP